MIPSSCQLKINSSSGITPFVLTIPFAVIAPFTPTAPFRTLASSWPETVHQSHPALAHYQDQLLSTMSPTMHPSLKFERYVGKCTLSNCWYAHLCWTTGCHRSHPGKGCPKLPKLAQPSSNTLMTRSVGAQACRILFPSCLMQLK